LDWVKWPELGRAKSREIGSTNQGDLLNDLQRHYRMNFPHRITFRLASSVRMVRGRVCNVIECFASDRDYVRLANFELLGRFETERECATIFCFRRFRAREWAACCSRCFRA